ncbi:MAG: PAS domain S-box protein [Anaerolineales bacterium]|nr:PAS domain S-box protein [Anaerolineales bacterium]
MHWQLNPYSYALFFACFISIASILIAAKRWKSPGALALIGMSLSVSVWSLFYALELGVSDFDLQVLFGKIQYFGISTISLLWLSFTLDYTRAGRGRKRWHRLVPWLFPLLALTLVWTNDLHQLVWPTLEQEPQGNLLVMTFGHGPAFWAIIAYSYVFMVAGSVVILQRSLTSSSPYRRQIVSSLVGVAAIWFGNFMYITGLSPVPFLDLSPFGVTIAAVAYLWGIFRFGLLDLVPVASEAVLESMSDGVMVVDEKGRIVLLNKAFEQYTSLYTKKLIGKPMKEALKDWPELTERFAHIDDAHTEIKINLDQDYAAYFDLRVSPIRDHRDHVAGRVFVIHDITERKQAELRLAYNPDGSANDQTAEGLIPIVLIFRHKDGKIVEMNRSFILNTGYARQDALGMSLLQLGMWTAQQRAEFLRQLRKDRQITDHTVELRMKNGQMRNYFLSAHEIAILDEKYLVWIARENNIPLD